MPNQEAHHNLLYNVKYRYVDMIKGSNHVHHLTRPPRAPVNLNVKMHPT
jgi:hypothetical protein